MKNLRLKSARAAKDLSQQQLAELVKVSRQTISAIEKGDYNPTINLCIAICKRLTKPLTNCFGKNKQTLTAIGDLFHGCRFYFYRFKIKRKIATGNITMWGNCKN